MNIPRDNAQNWFRHQAAELGVLGSLGWIWWVVVLALALGRAGQRPESRPQLLLLKYTVAGFALTSLVGIPGQNLFVAMTIWTFAFWLLAATSPPEGAMPLRARARPRLDAILALCLALVFAGATAYAGSTDLRPPSRARGLNRAFHYGFSDPVDGASGETRANAHGVALPLAATSRLKLTVWVEHPDADRDPVLVEVWPDCRRVVRGRFSRNTPLTRVEPVTAGKRFLLETLVDRTFPSPDAPGRRGGLSVRWEFVE